MIDRYNNFYKERSASREKKQSTSNTKNNDEIFYNKENKNVINRHLTKEKAKIPIQVPKVKS